ncbi:MAG: hypothetical protein NTV80_19850, partial [Verrucomicrobia bacterium]|nr:hypothetical protein [Verrucomicrobiota bacterium]
MISHSQSAEPEASSSCCHVEQPAPKPSCCQQHGHAAHEAVKPPTTAKYLCPMCPGVESDKPGDCPKCGMAL